MYWLLGKVCIQCVGNIFGESLGTTKNNNPIIVCVSNPTSLKKNVLENF